MRSRCRCSMCPAIHINSRSWLRSSSTHEPSDPPPKVVLSVSAAGREGLSGPCHRRVPHFLSFRSFGVCQQKGIAKAVPPRGPGKNDWRGDRVVLVPRRTWELDSLNRRLSGPPGRELASRGHLSPPKLAGHEDRQADQSRSGETELPPPVSSSTRRRRPESEVPRRWDCATRAGGGKEGRRARQAHHHHHHDHHHQPFELACPTGWRAGRPAEPRTGIRSPSERRRAELFLPIRVIRVRWDRQV